MHHYRHQGRELTVGGGRSNAKPANAQVEAAEVEEEEENSRKHPELRPSVVADNESPHRGLMSRSPPPPQNAPTTTTDGVEYAELTFPPASEDRGPFSGSKRAVQVAAASSTLGRRGSAGRPRRDPLPGPSSASMQQLPRSHTQGSEDGEGNYTEIIGVLQPKAYTSQLVLKQQQEATQAILGMHTNAPSVFVEASKKLAKSYYQFVCADKRNLARSIVDLQASFEVAFGALEDIERTGSDVESLHYAIYGLEEALSRALTELVVIRDEVHTLTLALKQSEQFNLKLYEQLVNLDHEATDGIESSRQTLNVSRCTTNKYRIPQTTKEALGRAWVHDNAENSHGDVTITSLLSCQQTSNEFHSWVCRIQRELSRRHAEFSFLMLGLWTEEVCTNFTLAEDASGGEGVGCFRRRSHRCESPNEEVSQRREAVMRSLLLTHHIKIEDTPATLSLIQSKVQELGDEVFTELRRRRESLEEARSLHRTLNDQLSGRRHQLVGSLLATHQAVQTLLEMDEQNDGLVGKLIKTRPLFSELQEAVVKGGGADGGAGAGGESRSFGYAGEATPESSFKALPEVLGYKSLGQIRIASLQLLQQGYRRATDDDVDKVRHCSFVVDIEVGEMVTVGRENSIPSCKLFLPPPNILFVFVLNISVCIETFMDALVHTGRLIFYC
ncbi:unnamed protein product [Hydatigera taeniaeformis]|uniref:Uncharacterized protein n=1 Tax=Hydatigena taeniaeformis TaxID=6205 RepID=A0A158REE2_HYDTA|nr:unnamed protein product [Hydatigera taeniaeformis]